MASTFADMFGFILSFLTTISWMFAPVCIAHPLVPRLGVFGQFYYNWVVVVNHSWWVAIRLYTNCDVESIRIGITVSNSYPLIVGAFWVLLSIKNSLKLI